MKNLNGFDIQLLRLRNGEHRFDYKIDDSFFALFEQDLVQNGEINLRVVLIKGDALVKLVFNFGGKVILTCDRSLEEFDYEINLEKELFLKFGETYEELNDELLQLPTSQQEFNIAQHIFEFISLQIPYRKLHPKFDEEEDFFFSTHEDEIEEEEEEKDTDEVDPRWKELLKLKDKK